MSDQNNSRHYSTWLKWAAFAVIVICSLVLFRVLPTDRAVEALQKYVEGLGVWGPVVFGLIYAVATVLLVPGAILTIAAGAIFGFGIGIVVVSLASITGASLAFLIGRYLARTSVERMAKNSDKFAAVDEAVAEGGWKVIALLRLSPAIPFTYQNYLLGVTKVPFWTYVLASWPAMLPGTAMYVYLGTAGGVAAGGGLSVGQWVLLGVGLVATVAVTVYITLLAKKKLRERTDISNDDGDDKNTESESEQDMSRGWTKGAIAAIVVALLMVIATGCAIVKKNEIAALFGPPQVEMKEAYADVPPGPTIDHSMFDALLAKHVNAAGGVDYQGFGTDEDKLDQYLDQLADVPFDKLDRDERLALLINAYNAYTIRLILDHAPVKSIQDIAKEKRWEAKRWTIGSNTWSLNQIEHEQIRPEFAEPRIHFALVCAAVSCPPLRAEAYTSEKLDAQLESQTERIFSNDKWFSYDRQENLIHLTPICKWYRGDFEQAQGSLVKYVAKQSTMVDSALENDEQPTIEFLPYDWSLNDQENLPADQPDQPAEGSEDSVGDSSSGQGQG